MSLKNRPTRPTKICFKAFKTIWKSFRGGPSVNTSTRKKMFFLYVRTKDNRSCKIQRNTTFLLKKANRIMSLTHRVPQFECLNFLSFHLQGRCNQSCFRCKFEHLSLICILAYCTFSFSYRQCNWNSKRLLYCMHLYRFLLMETQIW